MRYRLVILDLDGTLVDSLPWFVANVNKVADRFGFRRVGIAELEALRHAGPREVLATLGVATWKLPAIARHLRRMKAAEIERIHLFPGAEDILRQLFEGGVRLALVSSDSEANARRQLGEATAAMLSQVDCGASLFGKATKLRRVLRRAGVAPAEAIAIGDEVRDIEAARAAGICAGAVTWGYGAREALHAARPDVIFERLDGIASVVLARP